MVFAGCFVAETVPKCAECLNHGGPCTFDSGDSLSSLHGPRSPSSDGPESAAAPPSRQAGSRLAREAAWLREHPMGRRQRSGSPPSLSSSTGRLRARPAQARVEIAPPATSLSPPPSTGETGTSGRFTTRASSSLTVAASNPAFSRPSVRVPPGAPAPPPYGEVDPNPRPGAVPMAVRVAASPPPGPPSIVEEEEEEKEEEEGEDEEDDKDDEDQEDQEDKNEEKKEKI